MNPRKAQEHAAIAPAALRLLGDSSLMLAHSTNQEEALRGHKEEMETLSEEEQGIQESARAEVTYWGRSSLINDMQL